MTLLAPAYLWLFGLLAAVALGYALLQRRTRHVAVRHPDVALVASVAPRRAGWRRHATALAVLGALGFLVIGLAHPARAEEVAREEAVVVLAIDTSMSMTATDVAPNRLDAAVAAAQDFVTDAPDGYRIGLVTFGNTATTAVPPTTDRAAVDEALQAIEPGPGTAAGEGLETAVQEVESAMAAADVVVSPDDDPFGAVILLADGKNRVGVSLDAAAQTAADADVPVFSVAYGTDDGTVVIDGETVAVPADPDAMAAVAEATGGETYVATTGDELRAVYDRIGTHIGYETQTVEASAPFAAAAALALALAFVASLLWAPRVAW